MKNVCYSSCVMTTGSEAHEVSKSSTADMDISFLLSIFVTLLYIAVNGECVLALML